jgi:hypothetical protein
MVNTNIPVGLVAAPSRCIREQCFASYPGAKLMRRWRRSVGVGLHPHQISCVRVSPHIPKAPDGHECRVGVPVVSFLALDPLRSQPRSALLNQNSNYLLPVLDRVAGIAYKYRTGIRSCRTGGRSTKRPVREELQTSGKPDGFRNAPIY